MYLFTDERQFFQSFPHIKQPLEDAKIRRNVLAFTSQPYINGALTLIRFYCNLCQSFPPKTEKTTIRLMAKMVDAPQGYRFEIRFIHDF